jgi:hypothetical protein
MLARILSMKIGQLSQKILESTYMIRHVGPATLPFGCIEIHISEPGIPILRIAAPFSTRYMVIEVNHDPLTFTFRRYGIKNLTAVNQNGSPYVLRGATHLKPSRVIRKTWIFSNNLV